MAAIQFGLMMRAQFPHGDDMPLRFRELVEQARMANTRGFASLTKGMHYSAAPLAGLRLHRTTPQSVVLDELHMLAEEVFPRVRRG